MTDKPTPTDAATPECLDCSDHGAVGNILTAEPCPDCTRLNDPPAPATQQAGATGECMGPRCMASSANGYAHSRECIDEAAETQGWTPTADDYAKCGPSAPQPSPTARADSVQEDAAWMPLTPELLTAIESGDLGNRFWIAAHNNNEPQIGVYEWRQGRNPHGFNSDLSRYGASEITHVLPYKPPALPAAHGIKGSQP